MVELRFDVSEVDFDSVIQALAGSLAGPAAMAARLLPDGAKEEMVAGYINANAEKLEQMLENALASKGVKLKISGAKATKIQ